MTTANAVPKPTQIRVTRRSPAYWRVTIDHPPLNVMIPEMIGQFQDVITALEADDQSVGLDARRVALAHEVEGILRRVGRDERHRKIDVRIRAVQDGMKTSGVPRGKIILAVQDHDLGEAGNAHTVAPPTRSRNLANASSRLVKTPSSCAVSISISTSEKIGPGFTPMSIMS